MEEFDINNVSSKLIQRNFFYGYIVLQMKKVAVNDPGLIMAVGSKKGSLILYYNPIKLQEEFNVHQWASVLEHEVRHVTNGHVFFMNRLSKKIRILANIAMDMAINYNIQGLPSCAVRHNDYNLPGGLSCEEYYKLLLEYHTNLFNKILEEMENGDSGAGGWKPDPNKTDEENLSDLIKEIFKQKELQDLDNHDEMTEGEIPQDTISRIINEALQSSEMIGKTPGNISSELEWMKSKNIDWKKRLRNVISHGTLPSEDFKLSKNRYSTRYGTTPGIKKELINTDICCIIDTSGSMTNRSLSLFFGEIQRVKQFTNKVNVVMFDVGISDEFEYHFEKTIDITGRGGTTITKEMVEDLNNDYRKHFKILFTDGYINFSECEVEDLKNVVWVLTEKKSYNEYVQNHPSIQKQFIYFDE